jgi:hypothetical protein
MIRICPGRLFAEDSIFIAIATSVSVFNIQKKTRNGTTVQPIHSMTPGFIRQVDASCCLHV